MNLSNDVSVIRLTVREVLLEALTRLHDEKHVPLRDIVAEMLAISSSVVDNEACEIALWEDFQRNLMEALRQREEGTVDDEAEEYDAQEDDETGYEPTLKFYEKQRQFGQSDITQEYYSVEHKLERLERLGRYVEAVAVRRELVDVTLRHAKAWREFIESLPEEERALVSLEDGHGFLGSVFGAADPLMEALVVMHDRAGIDELVDRVREVPSIFGESIYDMEFVERDIVRYYEDLDSWQNIYRYIKENPGCLQRRVVRELSLDGRRVSYMWKWAERLNVISRVRRKDQWELRVI